jgi:hypothetical protein
MTCELLTESRGAELLILFQEAFHAKILVVLEMVLELMEKDQDYGPKCPESLARYNHHTALWKTAQYSLFGGLEEFSGTWPRWGMMQNGEFLELKLLEGITRERDVLFWPTIVKNEGPGSMCLKLTDAVAIAEGFAPRYYKTTGMEEKKKFTGKVNPMWAEWLMGWVMSWTDLKESVTDRFQRWLNLHGIH